MKILYFDCKMGASGDMILGALYELAPNGDKIIEKLNSFFEDVNVTVSDREKLGTWGKHIKVEIGGVEEESIDSDGHDHDHDHSHSHATRMHIYDNIESLPIDDGVKVHALDIFNSVLRAESVVHKTSVSKVHLHELGNLDAIIDIVGACMMIEDIGPDKIICSHLNVGSGFVRCAHGIVPVPAPATTILLEGMKVYSSDIRGELTTPTGAAILGHFCEEYIPMPPMNIKKSGIGVGNKDFELPNVLRAFVGEAEEDNSVSELIATLDDITSEQLSFATEILMQNGALDAYITPITMKKGRSAFMLTCLVKKGREKEFASLIFKYTTTIGIRYREYSRFTLSRKIITKDTKFGPLRYKLSEGYGVKREKAEFDDLKKISVETGLSIDEIKSQIEE
ncbi:MAG: nickel pincer cofactor biosynthesis protein LarC [Eubacteriaceae bacterium]|nr:nickel pincer cofactor biosynthesis protein LarC [Eubacteriaceae bacterium]